MLPLFAVLILAISMFYYKKLFFKINNRKNDKTEYPKIFKYKDINMTNMIKIQGDKFDSK